MSAFRFSVLAALVTMAFLVSSERVVAADETATVEGTITLDGKPLPTGARIFFHFDDGQFVGAKVKDGKFKMKAVPTGMYRVTVEMWKEMAQILPAKYAAEDKSELSVQVKKGANTLDFRLASK